jgi:hypothetical protein
LIIIPQQNKIFIFASEDRKSIADKNMKEVFATSDFSHIRRKKETRGI